MGLLLTGRRATNRQTISHNFNGDFLCHLNLQRDKLALINHLRKCKKGKTLTITASSFTEVDQTDSARCSGPDEKILPAPGTYRIAGFVELRPLTCRKKDKGSRARFSKDSVT